MDPPLPISIPLTRENSSVSPGSPISTFNVQLRRLVAEKKYEDANSMFNKIQTTFKIQPDLRSYIIMMDSFRYQNKLEPMINLMEVMKKDNVRPTLAFYWSVISQALKKKSPPELIMKYFSEMRQSGIYPPVNLFNAMISSFARIGERQSQNKLIQSMIECNVKPDLNTFNALLYGLYNSGETEKMLKLYDQMKKIGTLPNTVSWNILIRGLAEYRDTQSVLNVYREMKESGGKTTDKASRLLVRTLIMAGEIEEVEKMLENELLDGKMNYELFLDAIYYYSSAGNLEKMESCYHKLIGGGGTPHNAIIRRMMYGFKRARAFDKVTFYFNELKKFNREPSLPCYNILIDTLGTHEA